MYTKLFVSKKKKKNYLSLLWYQRVPPLGIQMPSPNSTAHHSVYPSAQSQGLWMPASTRLPSRSSLKPSLQRWCGDRAMGPCVTPVTWQAQCCLLCHRCCAGQPLCPPCPSRKGEEPSHKGWGWEESWLQDLIFPAFGDTCSGSFKVSSQESKEDCLAD